MVKPFPVLTFVLVHPQLFQEILDNIQYSDLPDKCNKKKRAKIKIFANLLSILRSGFPL